MAGSMPRHDEPRAPVTEADVLAHLSRSRKPQSLREIAAALGLRHSGRRALVKLARKMKKRGEIHEYPNGRVALPKEKQARSRREPRQQVASAPQQKGRRSGTPRSHGGNPRRAAPRSESTDRAPRGASRRLRLRRAGYAAKRSGRRSLHRPRRAWATPCMAIMSWPASSAAAVSRTAQAAPKDASCACSTARTPRSWACSATARAETRSRPTSRGCCRKLSSRRATN